VRKSNSSDAIHDEGEGAEENGDEDEDDDEDEDEEDEGDFASRLPPWSA
jgi:hypothetical protein